MANTPNLDLYLPQTNDYVNVKRDLEDNFKKIDDAFTIEDITSTLTFNNDITIASGGVYKIGKLVVVQLRFYSDTISIQSGTSIVTSGLPFPKGIQDTSLPPVCFNCNRLGLSPYYVVGTHGIGMLQLSTEVVPTGTHVYITGTYICE